MTPLGHLSTSYIVAKIGSSLTTVSLSYCLIGGIIPDIDFVSYFWGELNSFHRTYTHSIGFLFLCLFILSIIVKKNKSISLFSFSVGFMLHLIIDAGMDSNISNGMGIPMLWPFYDEYIYWFTSNINDYTSNQISWDRPLQFIREKFLYVLFIEVPFYIYAIILLKKKNG